MNPTNQVAQSRGASARANGAQPTESDRAAAATMLRMIWGIHISPCVYVVAELRIADRLADGAVSSNELARATGTDELSLYRVLRLLAALGVLTCAECCSRPRPSQPEPTPCSTRSISP